MKQQCVQCTTASQHLSGDTGDLIFIQIQHLEPLQLSQSGWNGLHHKASKAFHLEGLTTKYYTICTS